MYMHYFYNIAMKRISFLSNECNDINVNVYRNVFINTEMNQYFIQKKTSPLTPVIRIILEFYNQISFDKEKRGGNAIGFWIGT